MGHYEGEHQAVGIACFLSETRQGPGNLPIVLDDPVSSLDHERRTRVAKRLLGEAKNRQVIVFTHDVGFYTDVMSLAAELGVPVQPVSLLESAEGFGLVEPNGEPWMMKKVDARLHYLESERLPKIKKAYEAKEATYADDALGFAGRLRETWERLVEEILFNATVIRFRRSVETLRLDAVSVDDNSWKAIYWGIKRTSKWSGHDDPSEAMDSPPSPQDFQEEINHIRECKKEIARVNKEVMKRRKALLLPPKP